MVSDVVLDLFNQRLGYARNWFPSIVQDMGGCRRGGDARMRRAGIWVRLWGTIMTYAAQVLYYYLIVRSYWSQNMTWWAVGLRRKGEVRF